MKTNNFISLPKSIFTNKKNVIRTNFFNNINQITSRQFKVKLFLIAHAQKINNCNNTNYSYFKINFKNLSSIKSPIHNLKISKNDFIKTIKELDQIDSYIGYKEENDDCIYFTLKSAYFKEIEQDQKVYIDLEPLLKYRSMRQLYLHIFVDYFSAYNAPLYFLIDLLGFNKAKNQRKNVISDIKRLIKTISIVDTFKYIFESGMKQRYSFTIYRISKSFKSAIKKATAEKALNNRKNTSFFDFSIFDINEDIFKSDDLNEKKKDFFDDDLQLPELDF